MPDRRQQHTRLLRKLDILNDFRRSYAHNAVWLEPDVPQPAECVERKVREMQEDIDGWYDEFHARIYAGEYGEPRCPTGY